jgi:hypothetical protein
LPHLLSLFWHPTQIRGASSGNGITAFCQGFAAALSQTRFATNNESIQFILLPLSRSVNHSRFDYFVANNSSKCI